MSIELDKTAFLTGDASGFLEELYTRYVSDPATLDPSWREVFADLDAAAAALVRRPGIPMVLPTFSISSSHEGPKDPPPCTGPPNV